MPTIQQLVGTRVRELRKARGWTLEALAEKADKHYCNVAYVAAETEPYFKTSHGEAVQGRAEDVLPLIPDGSVDLIFTSPPYALHFKKEYGNVSQDRYVDWLVGYAPEFRRVLSANGSLVLDLGGSWQPGNPIRSLCHFEVLLRLVNEFGFHLAQEF